MKEWLFGVWVVCWKCRPLRSTRMVGDPPYDHESAATHDFSTSNTAAKALEFGENLVLKVDPADGRLIAFVCPVHGDLGPVSRYERARKRYRADPCQTIRVRLDPIS